MSKNEERDYIREAELKILKRMKYFDDVFNVLDALATFGNCVCNEYVGKKGFFEGLQKIRNSLLQEYYKTTSEAFMFVSNSSELQKHSFQKFKNHFDENERYCIMNFLDEFGRLPSSWKVDEEKEFRRQAKKYIEENNK